jgi:ATP-dependent helicase HrpA
MARDREAVLRAMAGHRRPGGPGPGALAPERLEGLARRLSESAAAKERRRENVPKVVCPEALPIAERSREIVAAIAAHPVVIVAGETGSGKSTQIPKFCLAAGRGVDGMIGHTQPRRIAAVAVATRIAEELGQPLGAAVGYKIRFTDRTSRDAYIKVMTDGVLLAETQSDPALSAYDTIIVDEAHERSLNIDFILGYLKRLRSRRRDLRLVITSATIDTEKFAAAFDDAPVIQVSGRMYPVEVRYRPPGGPDGEEGEASHVELAVRAVAEIERERAGGDILVFMPTEQDIRETCELIEAQAGRGTHVQPLFARLSVAEQARVFRPAAGRKIVVATNVAETSLTIPGIRYVVDTGLARIARYLPRTRTTALPVAPIARSSADQRMGRCGRVAEGVCIRLYAEEDYLERPQFTAPEILRANLAEVILRMIALRLGPVEEFPFIDRPDPRSVRDGFNLLVELGAIREGGRGKGEGGKGNSEGGGRKAEGEIEGGRGKAEGGGRKGENRDAVALTETGRKMARIPLDPRISRVLIEAAGQGSLAEVAVIAAALSIADPRERPAEKAAEADRAHGRFSDPSSDFATLLNIWNRWQETRRGQASNSQLRRFCRDHFLSHRRMREWTDIHRQIVEILAEFGIRKAEVGIRNSEGGGRKAEVGRGKGEGGIGQAEGGRLDAAAPGGGGDWASPLPPAVFEGVHRAILAGLLSNVAEHKEGKLYRAARGREAMIFPGSGLFKKPPPWIVCAEMVETSRLFARTVAAVESAWIESAAGELCRRAYLDPRWDKPRGEVVASEQVSLFGLVLAAGRRVSFGRIDPAAAAGVFIRSALVPGEVSPPPAFLKHNLAAVAAVRDMEHRLRRRDLLVSEEAQAAFYRGRLPGIADVRALKRLIRSRGGDDFLRMTPEDLMNYTPDPAVVAGFPEHIALGGHRLRLSYRFEPGQEADGVTVTVPAAVAAAVPAAGLDWVVPGLRREKLETLVKGLPKEIRKRLPPGREVVETLLSALPATELPLASALSGFLHRRFGLDIPARAWQTEAVADHLRLRIAVTAPDGRTLAAGRDPAVLRRHPAPGAIPQEVRDRWERAGVSGWDFGELPETLSGAGGTAAAWVAFPAIERTEAGVRLRLFTDRSQAAAAHPRGVAGLYAARFSKELKRLGRQLMLPPELDAFLLRFGGAKRMEAAVAERVVQDLFARALRTPQEFEALAAQAGPRIAPRHRELCAAAVPVLTACAEAQAELSARFPGARGAAGPLAARGAELSGELERLVPANFIGLYDLPRLAHLPRYVRALAVRAARAGVDLEKDAAKTREVGPAAGRLNAILKTLTPEASAAKRQAVEELFWLIEEYKVSVFAQELGTAVRISAKRLAEKIGEVERMA